MPVGHNEIIIIIIIDIVKRLACVVPVLYQLNIQWDIHNVLQPALSEKLWLENVWQWIEVDFANVLPTNDTDFHKWYIVHRFAVI